ncbi:unnamed protein product [Pelagomonas calceolata]|uniref:Uncharacterized protein n=1 Tax=Pelagomonas calceolata TaxID=35677 RepID=A0A8J2S6X3_9STRA|nr:unnamed protein product [Pelagomonas calceolata]
MAETMALRAGDGSTGSTTPLGDFDLRRWGDDAVMTEGERNEWRRRHAKAAPARATDELPKADEATAPPSVKKLVTPPSSVCDPDETVVADEPVVAPEGVIVSDGSDSDEGLARDRAARLDVNRRLQEIEARQARLEARLVARIAASERGVADLTRLVVGRPGGLGQGTRTENPSRLSSGDGAERGDWFAELANLASWRPL